VASGVPRCSEGLFRIRTNATMETKTARQLKMGTHAMTMPAMAHGWIFMGGGISAGESSGDFSDGCGEAIK